MHKDVSAILYSNVIINHIIANLKTATLNGIQILFLLFATWAASTNIMKRRVKLQKEILVYMTNLVEYKGGKTYLFIEDDKMQIQALGSDRSAFLR